jgi:hypothetical protein
MYSYTFGDCCVKLVTYILRHFVQQSAEVRPWEEGGSRSNEKAGTQSPGEGVQVAITSSLVA